MCMPVDLRLPLILLVRKLLPFSERLRLRPASHKCHTILFLSNSLGTSNRHQSRCLVVKKRLASNARHTFHEFFQH